MAVPAIDRQSVSSDTLLKFPSEERIIQYLKMHPLTSKVNNPWLTEKKVIEAVAKIFADSEKVVQGIKLGLYLVLADLDLGLPQFAMIPIVINLEKALIDCANGKPIDLLKEKPPQGSNIPLY